MPRSPLAQTRIGESDVAAAKSNLAFSLVSSLDSPSAVADASFCDTVVLGRPANYAALALKRVQVSRPFDPFFRVSQLTCFRLRSQAVTAADVERVIKTWAVPLFDSKTSVLGAAATPDKRKELVAAFGALGYEIDDRQF